MTFNPDQLIPFVKKLLFRRLILKIHIIMFIVTNALLFFLNNPNFEFSEYQWWPWAFTGWAVFIAFHLYAYSFRGVRSLFEKHLVTYAIINPYLLFVDWYSGNGLEWAWIPLLMWGAILIIHGSFRHELTETQRRAEVIGALISDAAGRVLIDAEMSPTELGTRLGLTADKIEMIHMFINAIQSFSNEINIKGCNDFQLFGTDLKVISVKKDELTITGFISSVSDPQIARTLFESILTDFAKRYRKEIEMVQRTGNCDHFLPYRDLFVQRIKGAAVTFV